MVTDSDLKLRAAPMQARSRETFERIIDAAAALLEEVGVESFNTNLLSQRSGVSVRAIYRYFPNKFAVLVALGERFRKADELWLGNLGEIADAADWRAWVRETLDRYYKQASTRPGYAAFEAARAALPELQTLDRIAVSELKRSLLTGLLRLRSEADQARMTALCEVIVEAADRVLSHAVQHRSDLAPLMVEELHVMIVAALERHLP